MSQEDGKMAMHTQLMRQGAPTRELADEFVALFHCCEIDKGEHLLLAGEHTQSVWFLEEGILRMYYCRSDGKEFNKVFVRAGGFVGALESLLTNEPSRVSIQGLRPSRLLVAHYEEIRALFPRSAFFERWGRLLAERLFVRKAQREASLLMDSAPARYEAFLAEMQDVAQQIPDYHIASYLGITPEALSRIRRNRSRSG